MCDGKVIVLDGVYLVQFTLSMNIEELTEEMTVSNCCLILFVCLMFVCVIVVYLEKLSFVAKNFQFPVDEQK